LSLKEVDRFFELSVEQQELSGVFGQAGDNHFGWRDNPMSAGQSFLRGIMVAWLPFLIALAWFLWPMMRSESGNQHDSLDY
jgi:hypothetical protein